MYLQLLGTAMGTKCAHPYACLTVGYLEETTLFTNELPKYFNESKCKLFFLFFFFYIYNLHFFKQKTYSHQVLIYLNVPGIPVRKPLQNRQIVS